MTSVILPFSILFLLLSVCSDVFFQREEYYIKASCVKHKFRSLSSLVDFYHQNPILEGTGVEIFLAQVGDFNLQFKPSHSNEQIFNILVLNHISALGQCGLAPLGRKSNQRALNLKTLCDHHLKKSDKQKEVVRASLSLSHIPDTFMNATVGQRLFL